MKLVFKGKFKSYDELPKTDLPEDAVMFKEPKTMTGVNIMAALFVLPAAVIMFILLILCRGTMMFSKYYYLGILIAFLLCPLHEYIHALFCGKDAEVYMYYSIKHFNMFVIPLNPMTKARFIVMSFMPAFILGFIPFFTGLLFLPSADIGGILMAAGFWSALFGGGDYMNMFNATVQMPKGSLTRLSGMNSYWYIPQNNGEN